MHMRWTTKALVQRALAGVPLGREVYYIGQRLVGSLRHFGIDRRVRQGTRLLECLYQAGGDLHGQHVVEIGTGWAPVLPLLYWLCGQAECHTYDVARLLRGSLVIETAKQLVALECLPSAFLETSRYGGKKLHPERRKVLQELIARRPSAAEILRCCGISYHAPADAGATGLPDQSVGLVFSNLVLEHVPEKEIDRLLGEAHRILKPGGYMLHSIDLSDHFSHSDWSITGLNFLRFSAEEFAKYNSVFCFQNRLRAPAYRQALLAHGFEIVCWEADIVQGWMQDLDHFPLHRDFVAMSAEDICTRSIHVAAVRPR